VACLDHRPPRRQVSGSERAIACKGPGMRVFGVEAVLLEFVGRVDGIADAAV